MQLLEIPNPLSHMEIVDAERIRKTLHLMLINADQNVRANNVWQRNVASKEDKIMRTIDYSPLYRSTVGFDRLFSLLDNMSQPENGQSYPPYNIERTGEDKYRITMAVAGFSEDDLSIEVKQNSLTVTGNKEEAENGDTEILFRGIAGRSFERRFQLADHVEITQASMENGLLHIDLAREIPEAMKPRKIEIGSKSNQIEAKAKK